jgi:diguanylate cyclase (GGDEF)-like protein/PAS domain S-box-containing protein
MLPSATVQVDGGLTLASPARIRVIRYRKGIGPATVRVQTAYVRSALVSASREKGSPPLRAALDCVITTDHHGRIIEFNPAAERTFGYTLDEIRGKDVAVIIPPRLRSQYRTAIARYLTTGESRMLDRRVEMTAMRRDGSEFPVELCVTRIALAGPALFTAYLRDIADRKRSEGLLHFLADHDPLTGLVNRRRFEEELRRQIAHAERYTFGGALLIMDLDHFKQINDTLGHSAGDAVIKNVAGLLQRRLRKGDTVGRLGGDEFAMLLPSASEQTAHTIVKDLLSALRDQIVPVGGHDLRVTASIGIAPVTGATGAEQLLVRADLAMYKAKELGGKGAWRQRSLAAIAPPPMTPSRAESGRTTSPSAHVRSAPRYCATVGSSSSWRVDRRSGRLSSCVLNTRWRASTALTSKAASRSRCSRP